MTLPLRLCQADYTDPQHAQAVLELLDAYARDPMGGGHPLSDFARSHLIAALAARPQAFSVLAWAETHPGEPEQAIGLANCIEGFSTFACKPLVNVHDLVVLPPWRGHGVGRHLLDYVAWLAQERGACKLTLEVLQGNASAQALYRRQGFVPYTLDPAQGHALLLQKPLPA